MPYYFAPMIRCKNPRNQKKDRCRQIPLPFPTLGDIGEYLPDWPPDNWREVFVCIDCGLVDTYKAEDIGWFPVLKETAGKFRNETNCFHVELQCAHQNCGTPVRFHIEIFDKSEGDLKSRNRQRVRGALAVRSLGTSCAL